MNTGPKVHPIVGVIILMLSVVWAIGLVLFRTQQVVEEVKTPWGAAHNQIDFEELDPLYELEEELPFGL